MNIAIDVSPLKTGNFMQHRVRGTGFYLTHLKDSLLEYYPKNIYHFFSQGEKFPGHVDVVHYPYFEPFFLTLPFIKRAKDVVTVHDLTPFVFPKDFPPGTKGKIKWEIQKYHLKRADAIIADSQSSKRDILRFCHIADDKIHVVYLAAGQQYKKIAQEQKDMVRKKYALPDEYALYVGDVTFNKNLPRIIEALTKIKKPLVMVGKALIEKDIHTSNPWTKDLVRTQALAKANPFVTLLGFVPDEDLAALYNAATVFVMPSLYEGFGLPILEAMASGCPVVTSKEGSLAEVAGKAAVFVDAYDVDTIAQGVLEVMRNKNLQKKLSQEGSLQAHAFSWEKTAKDTMNVYEKILS